MQDIANINFRTDARLKEEFASVVEAMGLTVTTAFNAFMRATVREQAMPFRLRASSKQTDDEREALALLNDPSAETFASARELAEANGGSLQYAGNMPGAHFILSGLYEQPESANAPGKEQDDG